MEDEEKSERDCRGRFVRGHPLINPRSPTSGRFQKILKDVKPELDAISPKPEKSWLESHGYEEPSSEPNTPMVVDPNLSPAISEPEADTGIRTFPEPDEVEDEPIMEKEGILDKHSLIAARVDMLLRKKIVK